MITKDPWTVLAGNDPRKDGKISVIMGGYGAGKTVLMQRIAREKFSLGGTVILRSKRKDTWQVFANTHEINIIAQRPQGEIHFDVQIISGKKEPNPDTFEVSYCDGPDQAVKMLRSDAINIIITSNMRYMSEIAWWALFVNFLSRTKRTEFISLFIDELHELFPGTLESDKFHFVTPFKEAVDNFRKSMVNFYFSTHNKGKLFYEIFSLAEYKVWMRGAEVMKKGSRIKSQGVIDSLGRGQAILEYDMGFVGFDNTIEDDSGKLLPSYNIIPEGEQVFDYYLRPDYLRILDLEPWWTQDCAECGFHWTTRRNQAPKCIRCGSPELEVRLGKFYDALFAFKKNSPTPKGPSTPPPPHA